MKIINVFLLSLSILFLSACSSKESIRVSDVAETLCSSSSTNETYDYLLKKMKIYYLGSEEQTSHTGPIQMGGGNSIGLQGSIFIENEQRPDGSYEISKRIKNGISHSIYGMMIHISKGMTGCNTNVKITYMNRFWKRHGDVVKKWVKEKNNKM